MPTERLLDYAGPAFRAARVRAGVTQAELAERAGVSTATISRIENGRKASTRYITPAFPCRLPLEVPLSMQSGMFGRASWYRFGTD